MEGEALSGIGFAKALSEEVRQSPDPINDDIKGRACLGRKPDVFDPGSNLFADFRRLLLAFLTPFLRSTVFFTSWTMSAR